VLTVSPTRTCSHDVWNIDLELVRTRFHGSMIFHSIAVRTVPCRRKMVEANIRQVVNEYSSPLIDGCCIKFGHDFEDQVSFDMNLLQCRTCKAPKDLSPARFSNNNANASMYSALYQDWLLPTALCCLMSHGNRVATS
jgi:hypothetical protein